MSTISEIISTMKDFKSQLAENNITQELTFLANMLASANINISWEILEGHSAPTSVRYVADSEGTLTVGDLSYLYDNDVKVGRVILTQKRAMSDFNSQLAFECNGVVLDSDTWDALVIPTSSFNQTYKNEEILKNMHHYSIYPIYDGTIINLYNYNDNWYMSTIHGYDVGHYKWIGSKTYMDVLFDVCDLKFDDLDKNICYTIGFRHNDFHPLLSDPFRAWLIRAFDLKSLCDVSKDVCGLFEKMGIEYQRALEYDEIAQDCSTDELFKVMLENNKSALLRYLTSLTGSTKRKESSTSLVKTMNSKDSNDFHRINANIHYGYILRADFKDAGRVSNIILESTLLKEIRQQIYNMPKKTDFKFTHENRLDYVILRAYLTQKKRETFLKLFPQFQSKLTKYDDLTKSIVTSIHSKLHNTNKEKKLKFTKNKNNQMALIDELSKTFLRKVEDVKMNAYDNNSRNIIEDYVIQPENINIFFKQLQKNGL